MAEVNQLELLEEAVQGHGGIRPAARLWGMPESTLRCQLKALRERKAHPWKKGDPRQPVPSQTHPEATERPIERAAVNPLNNTGCNRVLVVPDLHCPGMRQDFPEFLLSIYGKWQCNRVVLIGDVVDWHAINFHGKDPNLPDVKAEVAAARKQIQELYSLFPEADWLLGNHDALPSRQASTAGLPDGMLKGPTEFWEVPGWTVHPRFTFLEIDGVLYSHGETGAGGKYAAINQSQANFQSIVIGHYHSQGGVWYTVNRNHRIFGMSVGTGMDWRLLQFSYGWKFAQKPVLGCGVVIDGTHAYFEPMPL